MKKIIFIVLVVLCCLPVFAKETSGFGIHAGIGTDVSLGLAFGGGASYITESEGGLAYEFGLDLYYSHSDVTSTDGPMDFKYRDVTTLLFYAATFNTLFSYYPDKTGIYLILGTGAGAANVSWKGSSTDDPTYDDSWDRTAGGVLINIGAGSTFGNGFELRLQVPVLFISDGRGALPMLNVNAGYRF